MSTLLTDAINAAWLGGHSADELERNLLDRMLARQLWNPNIKHPEDLDKVDQELRCRFRNCEAKHRRRLRFWCFGMRLRFCLVRWPGRNRTGPTGHCCPLWCGFCR
jgi:hypothetical protein